jgi:hypothetical protein
VTLNLTMETSDRKIILREITEVEQRIARLQKQQEEAETILRSLKKRVAPDDSETTHTSTHPAESSTSTATNLTPEEKITLFLNLFQGREDVYPKLWQNQKTGKKGYSPACSNEWIRGMCEKPRVKCTGRPNGAFLPVTTEVILDHLQGRHIIGVWTGNCRIEPTGLLQRSGAIFINIAATRNGVFGKDSLLQVGVPRKPCK